MQRTLAVFALLVGLTAADATAQRTRASLDGPDRTLEYEVFLPSPLPARPPLLIMLHGCGQSVADLALGTRMDELAGQHGFIVVYPNQAATANPLRCWNWFDPKHQARTGGEAALVADLTRNLVRKHGADSLRVYVAGFSAGAAFANILAVQFPDLYAAAAGHAGVPFGAATTVADAFALMRGVEHSVPQLPVNARALPVLLMHGDADTLVARVNLTRSATQWVEVHSREGTNLQLRQDTVPATGSTMKATRTRYIDRAGNVRVEAWLIHGLQHAWPGGQAQVRFMDARPPSASDLMVRFLLAQKRKD